MNKKIIGVEPVNYNNKAGRPVTGVRLYISQPAIPPSTGLKVYDVFISGMNISDFPLGDIITVNYEPSGYGNNMRATGVTYAPSK